MSDRFPQVVSGIGDLQVISSCDEIFNHVDEDLPMWSEDGDRAVREEIVFEKPFGEIPNITLGLTGIDSAQDKNLRFSLTPIEVSRTGFAIEFTTWDDTRIARASASWQAVGPVRKTASTKRR